MKINQKYKTIAIIIAVTAIIALVSIVIIMPLAATIAADSAALAQEKQKISDLLKEASQVKKSETFYRTQLKNIERIDKTFINSEAPIDFMTSLEDSAALSNVTIEVSPSQLPSSKTKELPILRSLGFQLIIEGLASECLKFLDRLEGSPSLIEIRSVNIVRVDQPDALKNPPGAASPSISKVKTTIVISAFINSNR